MRPLALDRCQRFLERSNLDGLSPFTSGVHCKNRSCVHLEFLERTVPNACRRLHSHFGLLGAKQVVADEVAHLWNGSRVLFMGASILKSNLEPSLRCALQRGGVEPSVGTTRLVRHLGWADAVFDHAGPRALHNASYRDSGPLCRGARWALVEGQTRASHRPSDCTAPLPDSERLPLRRAYIDGPGILDGLFGTAPWPKALGPFPGVPDAVVIGYAAGHYGSLPDLESDTHSLALKARRAGVGVVLMTDGAQHFRTLTGAYDPSTQQQATCECRGGLDIKHREGSPVHESLRIYHRLARQLQLPLFDFHAATLDAHGQHLEGICGGYAPRSVNHVRSSERAVVLEKRRPCCDCQHFCYSPGYWDERVLVPLARAVRCATGAPGRKMANGCRTV